jgi:hypothetical protein
LSFAEYSGTSLIYPVPYATMPITSNNTLRFFTNSFFDIGVHKFKLTLTDGHMSSSKDLFVEFFNNPPFFIKEVPINMTIKFNNSFEYLLPPYMDAEGNNITVFLSGFPPVNAFMWLEDQRKLLINATEWSQVGSFKVNISLWDSQKINSYFFNVTI